MGQANKEGGVIMLKAYRRHKLDCSHRNEGRAWTRCRCPLWADGTFNGAQVRESLHVRTWDDTQEALEKLQKRLTAPEPEPPSGPLPTTIEQAWTKFLEDAQARNLSEATLRKYRYICADIQRFAADRGLRFIAEFSLDELRSWRATWPNRNLSAMKKLELVRCFMRFAHDANWIPGNPAKSLKSPKVIQVQTMPFTKQEFAQILAGIDQLAGISLRTRRKMHALILLLRFSGLRIRDAVCLSRERIDGDKLFLYTSKAGTPVHLPLPPFVITALDAAAEPHERYYFWTGTCKPQTATGNWQGKLQQLFKSVGVRAGHAHRFRDTFAVELLLTGVPLESVSVLLGHSSIRITERHYSPWVRARQEQLERSVRMTWNLPQTADEGTFEVHEKATRPN
jgi:integrase/recombinase XerD